MAIDANIAVSPGRITHLASGEHAGLAMIVNTTGERAFVWSIVLLDEKCVERWRVVVDDDVVAKVGWSSISRSWR